MEIATKMKPMHNGGYQIISPETLYALKQDLAFKKIFSDADVRYLISRIESAQEEIYRLERDLHDYELELNAK
jgi:hypothetical protein